MSQKPESRIDELDRSVITGLLSDDITQVRQSYEAIPNSLSRQEVMDLGLKINLTTGDRLSAGKRLEVDTINKLGGYALLYDDLTTARSAAEALSTFKYYGIPGKIFSLLLQREIRLKEAQHPALV
jgi:hypothetical protein